MEPCSIYSTPWSRTVQVYSTPGVDLERNKCYSGVDPRLPDGKYCQLIQGWALMQCAGFWNRVFIYTAGPLWKMWCDFGWSKVLQFLSDMPEFCIFLPNSPLPHLLPPLTRTDSPLPPAHCFQCFSPKAKCFKLKFCFSCYDFNINNKLSQAITYC